MYKVHNSMNDKRLQCRCTQGLDNIYVYTYTPRSTGDEGCIHGMSKTGTTILGKNDNNGKGPGDNDEAKKKAEEDVKARNAKVSLHCNSECARTHARVLIYEVGV